MSSQLFCAYDKCRVLVGVEDDSHCHVAVSVITIRGNNGVVGQKDIADLDAAVIYIRMLFTACHRQNRNESYCRHYNLAFDESYHLSH